MAETLTRILTDRRRLQPPSFPDLVRKAAVRARVGPGRIFRDIVGQALRRNGMNQYDFFDNHLYRPDLTPAERREFVGEKASYKLNLRLSPPGLTRMRGFLNDKIAFTALWHQFGIPTTTTRTVYSPDRWLGSIPALRTAQDITAYLTGTAEFPLFGKPAEGLQGLGSVRIDSVDTGAGTAQLGDGRVVTIEDLVDDIVRCFPQGYLFQDVVEQHEQISALAGTAVSCVRFVTVMDDTHPRILYTSWKIASPAAMADNFWQEGSMLARVAPESGIVENCVTGRGPEAQEVTEHPVSGMPIIGFRIPHWTAAADMVRNAHAMFPINGCLGWDVAIGPDGPLMIECNDNPGHEFYQMVNGRGILNPDIKPILDAVEARNRRIIEEKKVRKYKV